MRSGEAIVMKMVSLASRRFRYRTCLCDLHLRAVAIQTRPLELLRNLTRNNIDHHRQSSPFREDRIKYTDIYRPKTHHRFLITIFRSRIIDNPGTINMIDQDSAQLLRLRGGILLRFISLPLGPVREGIVAVCRIVGFPRFCFEIRLVVPEG